MMTEQDIIKRCKEICANVNQDFTIPVKINKRLTKTLGRVNYIIDRRGKIHNVSMEFSHQLLNTATFDSIDQVIKHECAHYLVNEITQEKHGHDAVFKNMCSKINCSNDGTCYYGIERTVSNDKIYKYIIKCKKCGTFIAGYSRKSNLVKYPDSYECKCGGSLEVIQNW